MIRHHLFSASALLLAGFVAFANGQQPAARCQQPQDSGGQRQVPGELLEHRGEQADDAAQVRAVKKEKIVTFSSLLS